MKKKCLYKKFKLAYKISNSLNIAYNHFNSLDLSLSLEQLEFINHKISLSSYLDACPGSGKTEIVGIKAAYEFSRWQENFSGIAVLSFTRNAADEIKMRVVKYAGANAAHHPHYLGTFDSWMHKYILHPFAHKIVKYQGRNDDKSIRIIDDTSRAYFLNNYDTKWFKNGKHFRTIRINEFYLSVNNELESNNDSLKNIDSNIRKELISKKWKFFSSGFATYQDAEYICCKILNKLGLLGLIARRFPIIIIDECQDLSPSQLYLLEELRKANAKLHFVGDMDQAIYEFRKVDPQLIKKFIKTNGFTEMYLTNNYRSNQSIVNVCQKLLNKKNKITGCCPIKFTPACILWQYSEGDFSDITERFNQLILDKCLDINKSAIVARGKSVIKKLCPQEETTYSVVELFANALNCWYASNHNTTDIINTLNQLGKSLCYLVYKGKGNSQKQYCPDAINSIEWRLLLKSVLTKASNLYPFNDDNEKLTWSKWAKELKKFLRIFLEESILDDYNWEDIKNKIKSPTGKASKKVEESIYTPTKKTKIKITTIHSIKGKTLDAVLLISAPNKKSPGGHFEHWLDNTSGNGEYSRFAYVACSRPKHLLVLATPSISKNDISSIISLGFMKNKGK